MFIFFGYRMLADDLKLSSDDDDTQRVGGALLQLLHPDPKVLLAYSKPLFYLSNSKKTVLHYIVRQ